MVKGTGAILKYSVPFEFHLSFGLLPNAFQNYQIERTHVSRNH
jgi:hypothetical protein